MHYKGESDLTMGQSHNYGNFQKPLPNSIV